MGSGPAVDVLLDSSLELGRDEGLAEGTPQLRHLHLIHQLPYEARSHRHALAHAERFHQEAGCHATERYQERKYWRTVNRISQVVITRLSEILNNITN